MSRKKRRKNRHDNRGEEERVEAAAREAEQAEQDSERDDETGPGADPPRAEDTDAGMETSEVSDLEAELERVASEAQEWRSLAQRKQAEFDNYRKRIERERAETVQYAAADVVKEMLPVLDNLERAVEAAKSNDQAENQLREGVEIVCKQFRDTLTKLGVSEVEAEQVPFDPHVHEAVGRVETDEHPEGTVVEVLQKGYLFKDRLLRPSMVSVSLPVGGESSQEEEEPESEDEAVRQGE